MKFTVTNITSTIKPSSLPNVTVSNPVSKIIEKVSLLLDSFQVSYPATRFKAPAFKFSLAKLKPNRRLSRIGIILLVAVVLAALGIFLATRTGGSPLGTSQKKIDQTYSVLARDKNGNSLNRYINLHVTDVGKVNTVLVQGQKLRARDGKEFLLVNFETDNATKTVFYLNPTDLVRYLKSDGKKFAPTVYQGILEVRPESSKNSNIGFVIEPKDETFVLEIGDLESQKQTLEIKF